MRKIKIGNKTLSSYHKPYIMAEISANHGQRAFNMQKIIDKIIEIDCVDAIKIQTYGANDMTSDTNRFVIEKDCLWKGQDLYSLYEKASTPCAYFPLFQKYIKDNNMGFFTTVFSEKGLEYIEQYNPIAYKIASYEAVDPYFVGKVLRKNRPTFISLGQCTYSDIDRILAESDRANNDKIILMICTSEYPAEDKDVNLLRIVEFKKRYPNVLYGLSDHSKNKIVPLIASMLGVCAIEKHIYLPELNISTPDSGFSLTPEEFREFVNLINQKNTLIGKPGIGPKDTYFCRSLYYSKALKARHVIEDGDIVALRPNTGLEPHRRQQIIGETLLFDVKRHDPVKLENFL